MIFNNVVFENFKIFILRYNKNMIDCTMYYVQICLVVSIILFTIGIIKGYMKICITGLVILISVPIYLFVDKDNIKQCELKEQRQKVEENKQFLLNNLEKGQCGNICLDEAIIHISKFSHYTTCNVSIRICKE